MKLCLCTAALLALASLAGCSRTADSSPTPAASSAASPAPPPAPAPAPAGDVAFDPKPIASSAPPAPAFKIVDAPGAADVAAGPVRGSASGRLFEPKTIAFETEKRGWKIILGDKPSAKPTDMLMPGSQVIYVSLNTGELSSGKKLSKTMKNGDGYFQIAKVDEPQKLTSWNTSNSYYVEITEWNVKPYDGKAGSSQLAGTASGKIYVAHKSSDPKRGFVDSGVSGTFTGVPVVYRGAPNFEK